MTIVTRSIPSAPSPRRLAAATALAAAVAGVILVTVVMPAEFGVDPTGLGARLGLDVLAKTPDTETIAGAVVTPPTATPALDAVGQPVKPIQSAPVQQRTEAYRRDTLSMTLEPGKGAEIKAHMSEGDGMVFSWTSSQPVAVDMHGERTDAKDGEYTSYWIEPARERASGNFVAPFEGTHGWYWLNRGSQAVTIEVDVSGFQKDLFFPSHK